MAGMACRQNFDLSVYFILDPSVCAGRDPSCVAQAAIRGGVTMLQLRDKSGDEGAVVALVEKLLPLTMQANIPLLVNDYAKLSRDSGADGVHLGQDDMSPEEAREILGPDKIIGVTAFEEAHFRALDPAIVDYAGTGPFYPTQTDKGKLVLGAAEFGRLRALSPVPVVGIGGITPDNAAAVIEAGADGVAMMRAISEAPDPEAMARAFERVKMFANREKICQEAL